MRVLITGGAGFIGSHLVAAFAATDHEVWVVDDLSRPGSSDRLSRLRAGCPGLVHHGIDITDSAAVTELVDRCRPNLIVHLAAQVAVTESLNRPARDFVVNTVGTINVLEAIRTRCPDARLIFASTNKVYGNLAHLETKRTETRHELPTCAYGIGEQHETDARTPYGCSKLAAELYVREYASSFGLATAVLRLSCVYGSDQSGSKDQGWVSWFVQQAVRRSPLTIFGDGLQVRDLLHVSDLVRLVLGLAELGTWEAPLVLNIGGGPENAVSVWAEFGRLLEEELGYPIEVVFAPARPDDQLVYISDNARAGHLLSWSPAVSVRDGVASLIDSTKRGITNG